MHHRGMRKSIDLAVVGGVLVTEHGPQGLDLGVHEGRVVALAERGALPPAEEVVSAVGKVVLPGLVDPHVHLREPGPLAEEDFATGTMAAAAGGITTVLEQPVDTPPTATAALFAKKRAIVAPKSYADFGLWGALIPDNLEEIPGLADAGAVAFKAFLCGSDPVYPMVDDGTLLEGMRRIAQTGLLLALHCENQSIIDAATRSLTPEQRAEPISHGRCRPPISELEAVQRAILLARDAGARLHILHLGLAQGARLVEQAKRAGQAVTVETCPHYLVLSEDALRAAGPYAKCNPPLRSADQVSALWDTVASGMIDCIVSDHSPYTTEDKNKGFSDIGRAPGGINALELGLSLMLSEGLHRNRISLTEIARLMATNPAKIFGLYPKKGTLAPGADADLAIVDLDREWTVAGEHLYTKNKWTPFEGKRLRGKVSQTLVRGKTVYVEGQFPAGPGYGRDLTGLSAAAMSGR